MQFWHSKYSFSIILHVVCSTFYNSLWMEACAAEMCTTHSGSLTWSRHTQLKRFCHAQLASVETGWVAGQGFLLRCCTGESTGLNQSSGLGSSLQSSPLLVLMGRRGLWQYVGTNLRLPPAFPLEPCRPTHQVMKTQSLNVTIFWQV